MSAGTTARARVRAELTREILDSARVQLAESGAASLSLRAVARSLDMAPSGLYRYFAGRDELLTALLIDSYQSLGAAAATADRGVVRTDHQGRWRAVTDAIWAWAHDHPHEWALLYGSPVPGYRAPEDTVPAAIMVWGVLTGIIRDAAEAGVLGPVEPCPLVDPGLSASLAGLRSLMGDLGEDHLVAMVAAWSEVFGLISMELFGHLKGGVAQPRGLWRQMMALQAGRVGLVTPTVLPVQTTPRSEPPSGSEIIEPA